VDTGFFSAGADTPEDWFLVVSALVPYKRIDLAIRAAANLGARLKIVGTGPDLARLRALAGPGVEFLGAVDDETLRTMYRRAAALILPGEEDFGISPVESLSCGRPVVALARGGACETIEDGLTGVLVADASAEAFAVALQSVGGQVFDPGVLHDRAERFSVRRFEESFRAVLTETLMNPTRW
jgi:glycosyltransferase involved in cell wall biosynthesis